MSETDPEPKDAPPASRPSFLSGLGLTRRVLWVVAALVVVPAVLFVGKQYYGWFGAPSPAARPAVGGPFALVDSEGRAVTDADFRGRFMLVYFGFTYCPDVCPTSLTYIAQALDRLGPDADKVVPVFITVDPERDTPEQLKEYVRHFHPKLVGLTGTPEQIAAAAKAYRVYFAKARVPGAQAAKTKDQAPETPPGAQAPKPEDPAASSAPGPSSGRPSPPDEYTMDHTSITYLMGRDGKFLAHFSHGTEPDAIAARVRAFF
jgi:protein SCO1/2